MSSLIKEKHSTAITLLGLEIQRIEDARRKAKEDRDKAADEYTTAAERLEMKTRVLLQAEAKIVGLQDTIDILRLEQARPE